MTAAFSNRPIDCEGLALYANLIALNFALTIVVVVLAAVIADVVAERQLVVRSIVFSKLDGQNFCP